MATMGRIAGSPLRDRALIGLMVYSHRAGSPARLLPQTTAQGCGAIPKGAAVLGKCSFPATGRRHDLSLDDVERIVILNAPIQGGACSRCKFAPILRNRKVEEFQRQFFPSQKC
jgi:hypothetical protein